MHISQANNKRGGKAKIRIGERLGTAAEYVAALSVCEDCGISEESGDIVCADIGCDHGYLSIYLAEKGYCSKIYAADIGEKPINIARKNIEKAGAAVKEKIEVHLCDGLSGLSGKGINRVVICGMGGEVMCGIIDRAREFWNKSVRFILQPMSSEYELREFLCKNGFFIQDETLVRDSGRIYTVMCVSYTGKTCAYSRAELTLGRCNIEKGGEKLLELCERKLKHARNLLCSKEHTKEDEALEKELCEILEKNA